MEPIDDFINIKKSQTGTPTYTPKKYADQFYFQDTGKLWIYIGEWLQFI
jgi:hypothetical protein